MRARLATSADAGSIARIYNQGIEERSATFETRLRAEEDILAWLDGAHPVVVVEEPEAGTVLAFARTSEYSPRDCYRGVFEFAVYTEREQRRRGAGALAMRELISQSRSAGAWKLTSCVFVENDASRALLAALGFREVGTYFRHGKLDGRWRDVMIVEKFLAPIGAEGAIGPERGRAPREHILAGLRSPSLEIRLQALEHARSLIDTVGQPDVELLAAAVDSFFMAKVHDPATRKQFVDLFRVYAALSHGAARDLYRAVFARLEGWSVAAELDAFYEALYVVKQVAGGSSDGPLVLTGHTGPRAPDLAAHVPRLSEWMKEAIGLPQAMRTRISPGNVTALLMSLALAGCESEEKREQVAELAAQAKQRHRVEPPASLRPAGRPPTLPPPTLPPPLPRPAPPPLPRPPPLPTAALAAELEPESILDVDVVLLPESTVQLEPVPPTSERALASSEVEAVSSPQILAPKSSPTLEVRSPERGEPDKPDKPDKKKRPASAPAKRKRGKRGKPIKSGS